MRLRIAGIVFVILTSMSLVAFAGWQEKELAQARTAVEQMKKANPKVKNWDELLLDQDLDGHPLIIFNLFSDMSGLTDISALKGVPFSLFSLSGASIPDITSLTGMPLHSVWLTDTKISDISPLKGMRLEALSLRGTAVRNISAIRGMPITDLFLHHTKVTDISALRGMPLRKVALPVAAKNIGFLRSVKSLKEINDLSAKEFWKRYDADGKIPQAKG